VLAVHYGLRQGELLGLKWSDIDLDAGTLQDRRTQSESRVGRIEEKPKNGRSRRIELSQSVCEVLRIHGEPHGGHELVIHHGEGYTYKFEHLSTAKLPTPAGCVRAASNQIPRAPAHVRHYSFYEGPAS
jgi:integrase